MGKWGFSMNKNSGKSFIYSTRIRYAEVDRMGVAYHSRYFEWFESARTELLRAMGVAYTEIEASGVAMPVVEAFCRYRKPVLYDEIVHIKTRIDSCSRSTLKLYYILTGEGEDGIRAEGYTLHCFVREGKSVRMPEFLENLFRDYLVQRTFTRSRIC
jgi:acyl-CoA thioester hydrolase